MGFRTVRINNRCKLELSINYLVCRNEKETRINIDEISTLIIGSTEVSITTALLSALMEKNINVIFCDSKYQPQGQLMSLRGTADTYKKIKIQMGWSNDIKGVIWQEIIKQKILNQARNLKDKDLDNYNKLVEFANLVEIDDITNREGHAAKVYFNLLFSPSFVRHDTSPINKYLDYGYSIILSCISREIKSFGYLTELGIHHIGETNPFNLACDFIEPLRPLIDYYVANKIVNDDNYKDYFVKLLSKEVRFKDQTQYLDNAIHSYVKNLLMNLREGTLDLEFIKYDF